MNEIGFIGCGNMGGAIARAVCQTADPTRVFLADHDAAKAAALAADLGCETAVNEAVFAGCEMIFLGVKPQMMAGVLADAAPVLAARTDRFVLVTMAAGLTIGRIRQMAGGDYPVIRIMPNTPVAIGMGMIQYCGCDVTEAEKKEFTSIMRTAGRLDELAEHLIDASSAVSGCGPAYAYQFIEALADGGVACGLPRAKAMEYAAQMLAGSAMMVLQSGKHPGELKDAVCSPGGSTIQGVRVLEQRAFRAAAIDAVIAACEKNKELGKN